MPAPCDDCKYEGERQMLLEAVRVLRSQAVDIADIKAELARGSERFRNLDSTRDDVAALRALIDRERDSREQWVAQFARGLHDCTQRMTLTFGDLASKVDKLSTAAAIQSKIVYGACGVILFTVFRSLIETLF